MTAFDAPPELRLRTENGCALAVRVWRLRQPWLVVSSAPLGGGIGLRHWVLNAEVDHDYSCGDPQRHLVVLAEEAGLAGPGVAMMTAVDVRTAAVVRQEGISVDATVGVRGPEWAAAPGAGIVGAPALAVGTINMVVALPVRLSDGALVNAISTATEAKTQALWEAGIAGTGTATDALCLLCPAEGASQAYGGPRSLWGAPLARAVHRAVLAGLTLEPAAS